MYDWQEMHGTTTEVLAETSTIKGYVAALKQQAERLDDLITTQTIVPGVQHPVVGAALLYAEDGWDGTFAIVLRTALGDAFAMPELLTLLVWTRNENPATRATGRYVKHVGQAGDDVLHTSDGNECIRFYDGTLIDLNDVVAVSF